MSTRFYKEEVGFEPTERVNVRQFSRLLQSTALALLQGVWILSFYPLNFYCQDFKRVPYRVSYRETFSDK